ncbi:MAG: DUF4868 domain-containing protein [Oscillospiraceae bacterium]|nr:DUF4868 domain-containing protein [Oscillospiraceae bacterium]
MKPDKFREYVRDVLLGEKGCGFSVYCNVRNGEVTQLKRFNIQDSFRNEIENVIIDVIKSNYLSEDVIYETADNMDDNSNALYLIEVSEQYNPFEFLFSIDNTSESFTENDKANLIGFAFCFSIDTKIVWAYQHVYPTSISRRAKGLFALLSSDSIFEHIDTNKLFNIESRVDALITKDIICPTKIEFLEMNYGLEKYIRDKAQDTITAIQDTGLINDITKFSDFISKDKLTNAKKLLKIKHSPILTMSIDTVVSRLSTIPRYDNISIEDGKITVTSQKDVANILKMLNDDFLRSELSQREYDSPAKKILPDA